MSRTHARLEGKVLPDGCTPKRAGSRHEGAVSASDDQVPVCRVPCSEHELSAHVPPRDEGLQSGGVDRADPAVQRPMRAARPSAVSPYAEPGYRAAKARLAKWPTPCWKGCGRLATTPDHVPALARHAHVAGSGCCELLPACGPCNMGDGARIGNTRRRPLAPTASRRW